MLKMVGFYSLANEMTERQLLSSAPKPVGIYDSRVHLRLSLDNPLPRNVQHFTNIHAGLKLGRNLLMRSGAANKQIIVITDGEPTAHIEGRDLLLIYPPSEKTAQSHPGGSPPMRAGGHPGFELRPGGGLLLFRAGELRGGDGPSDQGRGGVCLGGRPGQVRVR